MNKIDAYAQTKMDPKEVVETFKRKLMVKSYNYYICSNANCCFNTFSVLTTVYTKSESHSGFLFLQ